MTQFGPTWRAAKLEQARATLAAPHAREHGIRVEPVGALVATFVLPLELVKLQNPSRAAKPWQHAKLKSDLRAYMRIQVDSVRAAPLPGRPFVRCIRFSAVEPDKYSDGFKVAVDRLRDLNLIADDCPALCDLHQTWEYAPPKQGFGLIEVWTGAES